MEESSVPATWTVTDVNIWATEARLAKDTIDALSENLVDGATLVTLTKSELRSELGIASLPARRYLWDLIKNLRAEQETGDFAVAIEAHQEEIDQISWTADLMEEGPDSASGAAAAVSSLSAVVDGLRNDAQRQKQVMDDHLLAHRLQRTIGHGQQTYEDAEVARQEQERLNGLLELSQSDLAFAENLASTSAERAAVSARRQREQESAGAGAGAPMDNADIPNRLWSLFGLAMKSCATNKINVAEAFQTGKIEPIAMPALVSDEEEDDRKPAAVAVQPRSLPLVRECAVCYDSKVRGYSLACGHHQCVGCTRRLFRAALRDASLLPLRCCEVPIDMNISRDLLNDAEARVLLQRVEEIEATKKMYCPSCSVFLNLDLIDCSDSSTLECVCGTPLCVSCKTVAHFGLTCLEHQASASGGSDESLLELSRAEGWKQCPKCNMTIELLSGCNHMTCRSCRHEFCYQCLREWNTRTGQCGSGACQLWEEDRLIEAGEARVQQEEAALGRELPRAARQERLRAAVQGLRANEVCDHEWRRRGGYQGECPNCAFEMYSYGMHCHSDCGSTVCYTCAHHRIPQRGWR